MRECRHFASLLWILTSQLHDELTQTIQIIVSSRRSLCANSGTRLGKHARDAILKLTLILQP